MALANVEQENNYSEDLAFRSSVTNLFNNLIGTSGTLHTLNQGNGLCFNPSIITSSGTISLHADLEDLNNVQINTPQVNQALVYSGSCWINQAMSGTCPISFTSLTDTPNSYTGFNNNLVTVNTAGNGIVFQANNYKNSIVAGSGIGVVESNNSARILFDTDTILENFSSNSGDYFVIEDNSGDERKIKQSNINIDGFVNNANYLTSANFFGNSPITITTVANSVTIGLSTGELDVNDFNNGVAGILGIVNGGTSASTADGARENFNLVYNVDILSQSGPSFDNTLFGDNILLQPSNFTLSISAAGSGYATGTANLNLTGYQSIGISITSVDGSGGITGWEATDGGSSFLDRGNYPDSEQTWSVNDFGVGVGGEFLVTPEISYLNFGASVSGSHAIGWRNNLGTMELKQSEGSCWQSIFPINVNKIDDLITTGVSTGDIFIYNGTSWLSQDVRGFINIDENGVTTYAGGSAGIDPGSINGNSNTIFSTEFGTLTGMCSNQGTIQEQLDSKVSTEAGNLLGDLIYYDTSSGPSFWQPLSIGASRQILTTGSGTSIPEYNYLRNILNSSSSVGTASGMETYLVSNSGPDLRVPVDEIFSTFVGTSNNGIDISPTDSTILMNINKLTEGTNLASTDTLAYYDGGPAVGTKKITIDNFCQEISGTGLCSSTGVISIANILPLGIYTVGTSPSGSAGNLTYFSDGDGGNPCLGVHDGTCWRVVSLGTGLGT